MELDPTNQTGDGLPGPQRRPPTDRPAPVSAADLHNTLARLATAIAATSTPPRGADLRTRARSLLNAATGRRPVSPATRLEARQAVTGYVAKLRADGIPPERMLVVVKAAVRDATPGVLDQAQLHALTADVVRWSIEAFYAP